MKPPFFIVGCPRSGTTLLRDLLRTHPDLVCPEETNFFRWGDAYASRGFLAMFENNALLKKHRALDGISDAEFFDLCEQAGDRAQFADRYGRLFAAKQGRANARWFDKTPQNVYGMLLISALYPGVKFVHLHRHPLNVVASLIEGKVMKSQTIKGAASFWLEAIALVRRFREAWPDQVHELSYESLTEDPAACLVQLLEFVGEDPSRLTAKPDVVYRERNNYRSVLSPEDIAYVKNACSKFMAEYGYA